MDMVIPGTLSDGEARKRIRAQLGPAATEDAVDRELASKKQMYDERVKHMSPKGTLGLPKLLEQRRWDYLIPDEAFRVTAMFDRVLLWQVALDEGATYDGGLILKPDVVRKLEEQDAPQGVIVGAGLAALDALVSNGMGLGHLSWFVRVTPLRIPIGRIAGKEQRVLVLHCSDIVGSLDTAAMLKSRELRMKFDPEHNQHQYIDSEGRALTPVLPDDPETGT